MRATTTVLGHTCSGLTRFQSRIARNGRSEPDYPCRPVFDERGCVEGCDDTNYMPIEWCPFCGKQLAASGVREGGVMRECWVIEEQNDNGDWYVIYTGGKVSAEEELVRWPSTPENPKRLVRYVPAPPQEDRP